MATKGGSLLAAVKERAQSMKPARRDFFGRLPPAAQQELVEIRRMFQDGELGRQCNALGLARIIVAVAEERGWHVCGVQGIRSWLAKNK